MMRNRPADGCVSATVRRRRSSGRECRARTAPLWARRSWATATWLRSRSSKGQKAGRSARSSCSPRRRPASSAERASQRRPVRLGGRRRGPRLLSGRLAHRNLDRRIISRQIFDVGVRETLADDRHHLVLSLSGLERCELLDQVVLALPCKIRRLGDFRQSVDDRGKRRRRIPPSSVQPSRRPAPQPRLEPQSKILATRREDGLSLEAAAQIS